MERRAKAEQFRKSKNNYFKKGFEIGEKSEAEIFVLIKRQNKYYTFINTDRPFWSSQADINRNIAMAKTAADYQTGNRAKQDATASSAAPEQTSALATSSLEAPQQVLDSQPVPKGWEELFLGASGSSV